MTAPTIDRAGRWRLRRAAEPTPATHASSDATDAVVPAAFRRPPAGASFDLRPFTPTERTGAGRGW